MVNIWVNIIDYYFPIEFFKICWVVQTKNYNIARVFDVCRYNT